MSRFPWAAAMQFGLGVLRLPPAHFWGMTPRELAAAFEAASGGARRAPPPRATLEELMERYPDA